MPSSPSVESQDAAAPEPHHQGELSSVHATLNCVNMLMGVGILSVAFALNMTGWVPGISMMVLFALTVNYSAKLLVKCMAKPFPVAVDSESEREPLDIGELAFGHTGRNVISAIFCFELFAAAIAMIILMADSLEALFPGAVPLTGLKLIATLVVLPTTWSKSMKLLSYASVVGILATCGLGIILVIDGLSVSTSPGSILVPAETLLWPQSLSRLLMAIGLLIVGFDGHAVFPAIHRELKHPESFNSIMNLTYALIATLYIGMGSLGYCMFGTGTLPEITQNLATVPEYNQLLTYLILWLTAINPAAKYGLVTTPIHTQIGELLDGVWRTDRTEGPPFDSLGWRLVSRTLVAFAILFTSILVPGFHHVLSVLGSSFSFTIAIIFPILCFLVLFGAEIPLTERLFHLAVLMLALVFAVLGTLGAFIEH
ncbi:transmembrane amino acid transporter protein-domain-containing protein [Polychytrium aggregatum]|uniref:transmembrane amino acid transporter protein-domain-containing protein n=1 Tax=Polychytrium aggregatum TaxID=110093 RepID=UPI0022FE5B6A|nr:transmembrane amino acid transporter protein-domain-containing protein [Polychytrium aggregatum]KAI9207044.1 transmembrane amino acid transporter protein-domain-containing protein [Polychytrium aggregatum]